MTQFSINSSIYSSFSSSDELAFCSGTGSIYLMRSSYGTGIGLALLCDDWSLVGSIEITVDTVWQANNYGFENSGGSWISADSYKTLSSDYKTLTFTIPSGLTNDYYTWLPCDSDMVNPNSNATFSSFKVYDINGNQIIPASQPTPAPIPKVGSNDISKVYLGSEEISKIYLGTSTIYEKQVTTTYYIPQLTSDNSTYGTASIYGNRSGSAYEFTNSIIGSNFGQATTFYFTFNQGYTIPANTTLKFTLSSSDGYWAGGDEAYAITGCSITVWYSDNTYETIYNNDSLIPFNGSETEISRTGTCTPTAKEVVYLEVTTLANTGTSNVYYDGGKFTLYSES